jgi:hypothetical protein
MHNLKPFDPEDIDETLTRVVVHGDKTYLLFPFIDGRSAPPRFTSVSQVIAGPTASLGDFSALSALVKQAGETAVWFISFNTPWLLSVTTAGEIKIKGLQSRTERQ